MRISRLALTLGCAAMASSCGGGGGGATGNAPTPSPSPTSSPTPAPTTSQCSLSARQDWTLAQLEEWYLFPSLLNINVGQANYIDLQSYIDALVAPARAQSRDRYFTYVTSIEEENAFYEQGASAGFGFRLGYDTGVRRVFVTESFENAPALGQNIDRGTELLAIGTSQNDLVPVNTLMAQSGPFGVVQALGPDTPGTTRVIRLEDSSRVIRTVTLTKTEFAIDPVSDRYGAKIIDDAGTKVGYLNLRTFIDTAEDDLRAAFDSFRQQGVTRLVIDFRYNGGGLVSIATLMGDLMGRGETGNVFATETFRPSKSEFNSTTLFEVQPESVAPTHIAFIGTGSTASASEMVINGMLPYIPDTNIALVGNNTYGKPVGQIALDRPACDERLRVVAFEVENGSGNSDYYTGLADTVPNTCRADDFVDFQLGDPNEPMLATALDFLAGRGCTPIAGSVARTQSVTDRGLLQPRQPNTAQRNAPGIF